MIANFVQFFVLFCRNIECDLMM